MDYKTVEVFLAWYWEVHRGLKVHGYSDYRQGQLTMISNVLKVLLPDSKYKKITRLPTANTAHPTLL